MLLSIYDICVFCLDPPTFHGAANHPSSFRSPGRRIHDANLFFHFFPLVSHRISIPKGEAGHDLKGCWCLVCSQVFVSLGIGWNGFICQSWVETVLMPMSCIKLLLRRFCQPSIQVTLYAPLGASLPASCLSSTVNGLTGETGLDILKKGHCLCILYNLEWELFEQHNEPDSVPSQWLANWESHNGFWVWWSLNRKL